MKPVRNEIRTVRVFICPAAATKRCLTLGFEGALNKCGHHQNHNKTAECTAMNCGAHLDVACREMDVEI